MSINSDKTCYDTYGKEKCIYILIVQHWGDLLNHSGRKIVIEK